MLIRTALVIHWLGFIFGVGLLIFAFSFGDLRHSYIERVEKLPISPEGQAILDSGNTEGLRNISDQDLNNFLTNTKGITQYTYRWDVIALFSALSLVSLALGWVIRFILTGSKVIFPWSKPKESNP